MNRVVGPCPRCSGFGQGGRCREHDPQTVEQVESAIKRAMNVDIEGGWGLAANAALEASHHAQLRRIYVDASTVCYNATDESRPDGMILVEPDDWKALNDALDALEEVEAEEEERRAKIGGAA